jgi:hypothetical protein
MVCPLRRAPLRSNASSASDIRALIRRDFKARGAIAVSRLPYSHCLANQAEKILLNSSRRSAFPPGAEFTVERLIRRGHGLGWICNPRILSLH